MMTQRCNFRYPPGNAGVCGACVYWLLFPGGSKLLVEVSSSAAHEMEQARMTLEQVLAFLDLRWSGAVV